MTVGSIMMLRDAETYLIELVWLRQGKHEYAHDVDDRSDSYEMSFRNAKLAGSAVTGVADPRTESIPRRMDDRRAAPRRTAGTAECSLSICPEPCKSYCDLQDAYCTYAIVDGDLEVMYSRT